MGHHTEAFVGIDTSKSRNAIAIADGGRGGEVRYLGEFLATEAAIRKLVAKLAAKYRHLTFCYEAGPTGYGLYRLLKSFGHECLVVAPSLVPKKAGDRVKTNRRDAVSLAKLLRADELTAVWVPDERHEAMRDLSRARQAVKKDLQGKRQQISSLMLRLGRIYPGKTTWGPAHMKWLMAQKLEHPEQRIAFEELLEGKRIAIVSPATKIGDMGVNGSPFYRVFFEELSRLGYVEGQNLVVERYSGEGRTEHYADLAREVVNTHPDLILSGTTRLALNFKAATTTIPIVTTTADPIAGGLVSSLARPGGNITGVSVDAGLEVMGKRLALLLEATSKLSNARFLVSQLNWERALGAAVREASRRAGISLAGEPMSSFNEQEYQRVFNSMEHERVDGILVSDESEHFAYRRLLVELAAKTRIPAIYAYREHVELGGLMAYSFDLEELGRHAARQVAEVLKGANPGELPFYQQTKFELIINLKTAKALGLEMPATLVGRADRVIE